MKRVKLFEKVTFYVNCQVNIKMYKMCAKLTKLENNKIKFCRTYIINITYISSFFVK